MVRCCGGVVKDTFLSAAKRLQGIHALISRSKSMPASFHRRLKHLLSRSIYLQSHKGRSEWGAWLEVQGTRLEDKHASRVHSTGGPCPEEVLSSFQILFPKSLSKSLCVLMTGTFEALAISSTMITQSQKECLDQIHSLCQGVSHFVLQYRAKAMKDHCVNICEGHSSVIHIRKLGYLQAAKEINTMQHRPTAKALSSLPPSHLWLLFSAFPAVVPLSRPALPPLRLQQAAL